MIVYVAMDIRNRWFEIYATEDLAEQRVAELNTKYRTTRYRVSPITVLESINTSHD